MAGSALATKRSFQGHMDGVRRRMAVRGAVFEGDTAEARAVRRARAVWDLPYFLRTYLPHYFSAEFADFHIEMLEAASTPGLWCIRIPRDHGKTTVLSFGFTLHQVVVGPVLRAIEEGRLAELFPDLAPRLVGHPTPPYDSYIQVIGATLPGAEEITEAIKTDLEENDLIRADWGQIIADVGVNYDDWRTTTGIRVRAFGITGAIRGGKNRQDRPSLAFIDDPQDDDSVRSLKRRDRTMAKILRAVKYGLRATKRRVVVIGTPLHHDAVVCRLSDPKRYPDWKLLRYSARRPDGTPLFPARWTPEMLAEAACDPEVAGELFDTPPDDGQRQFPAWPKYNRAELVGRRLLTLMACDPAVGRTADSDLQCILVGKLDPALSILYIWRCELTRLPPADWARLVARVYVDESPDLAAIETIAQQEFARALVLQAPELAGQFPSLRRITRHAIAKRLRILGLIEPIRAGQMPLPDDGSCRGLEVQAEQFPDGKVDGLDTLAMVRQLAADAAAPSRAAANIRHTLGRRGQFRRAW